jgi:alpha-tubulin suppressor-like RCC1 family protein
MLLLMESQRRLWPVIVLASGLACVERSPQVASPRRASDGLTDSVPAGHDGCTVRTTALAAGGAHTCAIINDGTVRCWGANYRGQLGDGTTTFRSAPVRVEGLSGVVAIAAGNRHTCALRSDGTVWCWGANDSGQLGKVGAAAGLISAFGLSTDQSTRPLAVAAPTGVKMIAAGATHSLALTAGGDIYFWGVLGFQVGRPDIREPFKVSVPAAERVAAGADLDCALGRRNTVCWGPDLHWLGQEPNGTFALSELDRGRALDPFAVGHGLACGVDSKRFVHCWGERDSLGNGETRSDSEPSGRNVTVGGLSNVMGLASRWQSCAVVADGRVACWGRDMFSELADGGDRVRPRPVWVAGVADAVEVVVGASSACSRTREGRVSCWGENGYGQLGDATTEASAKPTEVRFCAEKAEVVFPAAPEGVPLVAALQRGPCFGSCPLYSVRVYDDGTVIYRGDGYVRVRGGRKTQLSRADLGALRASFRSSNFLGLEYQCRAGHTDDSTARVFFAEGGRARLISHYHGCNGINPALTRLEDEIDRITGTSRWVGEVENGTTDDQVTERPLSVPGVTVEPDERSDSARPRKHHVR